MTMECLLLDCLRSWLTLLSIMRQLLYYSGQQKMKKSSPPTSYRTEEIDGPPLDFGFKGIRSLSELASFVVNESKPARQESKPAELGAQLSSEKQLGEGQARLNIVRTIEVQGGKEELLQQLVNKKTEKTAIKAMKKLEVKTTALFLRYNKLSSLEGLPEALQTLLPNRWQQLVWLDLSHNRLTSISKHLQSLPQLKNLYLHVNFISSFKEFQHLQPASLLRTFTIHGNPIELYPQFRALLCALLPQLQKIDSALLTKREKQRGQVLKKQGGKYPVIANPQRPPEQSQEEEEN